MKAYYFIIVLIITTTGCSLNPTYEVTEIEFLIQVRDSILNETYMYKSVPDELQRFRIMSKALRIDIKNNHYDSLSNCTILKYYNSDSLDRFLLSESDYYLKTNQQKLDFCRNYFYWYQNARYISKIDSISWYSTCKYLIDFYLQHPYFVKELDSIGNARLKQHYSKDTAD